MILNEMFGPNNEKYQDGNYDAREDQTTLKLKDLRKTKLTLMQINRLRMMHDVRKFEQQDRVKDIQKQYKAAAAAPAM